MNKTEFESSHFLRCRGTHSPKPQGHKKCDDVAFVRNGIHCREETKRLPQLRDSAGPAGRPRSSLPGKGGKCPLTAPIAAPRDGPATDGVWGLGMGLWVKCVGFSIGIIGHRRIPYEIVHIPATIPHPNPMRRPAVAAAAAHIVQRTPSPAAALGKYSGTAVLSQNITAPR
jgi:hypothetical protein